MTSKAQDQIEALILEALDLHVHSGPDVIPRRFDDLDLARRALTNGPKGFVIKSHNTCTADRASLVRKQFPAVQAFGGIVLNTPVGGLNAAAVDAAGALGARIVWLPTVDSETERAKADAGGKGNEPPYWLASEIQRRRRGFAGGAVRVTCDGDVVPALRECFDAARHHGMIVGTGHIGAADVRPVVDAAVKSGVRGVIITHADKLSIELQKELSTSQPVFFERSFVQVHTGSVAMKHVLAGVRAVGSSRCIVTTDLGQPGNPYPDEGLATFCRELLGAGVGLRDIEMMVKTNPHTLLA